MSFTPRATYRLQFNAGFTFQDARKIVPYLADLGVDCVYASPIFRAGPGSTHGYDVCDHNELNPELGTREDFEAFSAELKAREMGLILDFVPNHMGIDRALNPWWRDILENGPASAYAPFFDIDWRPLKRELDNRVLLPILGDQFGRVLESDGFRVGFAEGAFLLHYGDLTFPLAPKTTMPFLRRAIELLAPPPAELESIATALENLPPRTETSEAKLVERVRESKIIRERLRRLTEENEAVASAIQRAVDEFQDPNDPGRFDRFDKLTDGQPYRLSSWRVAAEEINYRRFFDVNSLAAIRMELPEVFEATHRLLFELIDGGHVSGVRIDHIDGLADPYRYLHRLRERAPQAYICVEKILGPDEKLRPSWPVEGTTGYEFANQLVHVLADGEGVREMRSIYERHLGFPLDYHEVVYRSKRLVMQSSMSSEVNSMGRLLNRISESNRWYRDYTLNALTAAMRELIAHFPEYRTYIEPSHSPTDLDVRVINRAIALARKRNPAMERTVFEFLRYVLLPPRAEAHPVDENLRKEFVLKFQQCTGPITAKGVEDTAFYVYCPNIAMNEVGGEPDSTGESVETFHQQNSDRAAEHPACMLATSTHDTKRSEDVRSRAIAMSEFAEEWGKLLRRCHTTNKKYFLEVDGATAPDANEEQFLYQTLASAWPIEGLHDGNREEFVQRIQNYMLKALREGKVNTSWIEPNEPWDRAVTDFIAAILSGEPRNRFPQIIEPFATKLAQAGAIVSLAQTILKLTAPGMPDFYQGTEIWDLSLVDPDNRRPVDYDLRRTRLDEARHTRARDMLADWQSGRIKLATIHRLLGLRRQESGIFLSGTYRGLTAAGAHASRVIAFERTHGDRRLVVVVPRAISHLPFPATGAVWEDTHLPELELPGKWHDVLTGRDWENPSTRMEVLLGELPFAVLISR